MGDSEQMTPPQPSAEAPATGEKQPPAQQPAAGSEKRQERREGQQRGGAPPAGGAQNRPQPHQGGRGENRGARGEQRGGERGGGERGERGGDRGRGDRRPEGPPEIDLDKLINDSLYLDNQAHSIVSRMRDMDSGTRSQLRRFYNAVRRATRAPENERQHEFVMLRARLAYTIARHALRSLDGIERLLLQVTRRNEARGYERFRDLFEAIVAYNE